MTSLALYTVAGAVLVVAGLHGVLLRAHLFWKVLAVNVMAGGIFLILVSVPARLHPGQADPVPQAMALTGIVVAVATTAVALGMALRVAARTGRPFLPEAWPDGADAPTGADASHTPTGADASHARVADGPPGPPHPETPANGDGGGA